MRWCGLQDQGSSAVDCRGGQHGEQQYGNRSRQRAAGDDEQRKQGIESHLHRNRPAARDYAVDAFRVPAVQEQCRDDNLPPGYAGRCPLPGPKAIKRNKEYYRQPEHWSDAKKTPDVEGRNAVCSLMPRQHQAESTYNKK